MVYRTRYGLGETEAAVRIFDELIPFVLQIRGMQARVPRGGPEHCALQIAVEGLETAAYHFTRRRLYYEAVGRDLPRSSEGLGDRAARIAAFEALGPYAKALIGLQDRCKPFGRDYLALSIARQALDTAAYHFTKMDRFYAARGDSAGPVRLAPEASP